MTTNLPLAFESHAVRVRDKDGEFHFVGKDVAEALDYRWKGAQLFDHVPAEWKGVTSEVTPGGPQEMVTLSEQGLYFFLGRSDKPKALPMQKWLAGEVLPSIRRTGGYSTPDRLGRGARQEIGGIVKAVATRVITDLAPALVQSIVPELVAAHLAERRFQLIEGLGATDVIELAGYKGGQRPRGLTQLVSGRLDRFSGDRGMAVHRSHRGRGAIRLFDESTARLWLRSGGKAEIDAYVRERRGQGVLSLAARRP